mmetsp:Transcript_135502/g.238926  ORF Transcript_135502/g.238926 Transcript_135502/m.238926 type:complete len:108 (+) Transcript_135502:221-544(+)
MRRVVMTSCPPASPKVSAARGTNQFGRALGALAPEFADDATDPDAGEAATGSCNRRTVPLAGTLGTPSELGLGQLELACGDASKEQSRPVSSEFGRRGGMPRSARGC